MGNNNPDGPLYGSNTLFIRVLVSNHDHPEVTQNQKMFSLPVLIDRHTKEPEHLRQEPTLTAFGEYEVLKLTQDAIRHFLRKS